MEQFIEGWIMRPALEVTTEPSEVDRRAVIHGLVAYNDSKVSERALSDFMVRLRNSDGAVVGGLFGRMFCRWLFVELLFVPEELRGQGVGKEMMRKAEAFAAENNCIGVWLDTFTFQAPQFYQKLGYSVFGQIDDYPPGQSRVFLQKRL